MNDLKKMEDLENDLNTDTDLLSDESVIETIEQHKKVENGKFKYKIKEKEDRKSR